MDQPVKNQDEMGLIDRLFKVGAHFAYTRTRRHPTAARYIFGTKNQVEIFDLEMVSELLASATAFVRELGAERKALLMVGGKNEAREIVASRAESIGQPYVSGRWIGGSLTNFSEVRKRLQRMEDLMADRDSGKLQEKYTKRERLMIDREIEELQGRFGGLSSMKALPAALFVVDPRREHLAVAEARTMGIPIVALLNSDCNLGHIDYPIAANDAARESIAFITDEIVKAYREGLAQAPKPKAEDEQSAAAAAE